MEVEFRDEELENLYEGKKVRNRKYKSNPTLVKNFIKTVERIEAAPDLDTLKQIASLNLEDLQGDLKGYSSVRVNKKYRLIIELVKGADDQVRLVGIEDLTNHYQ